MMIIMKANATPQEVEHVIEHVKSVGLAVHLSQGIEATIIGAIGETHNIPVEQFEILDGVDIVKRITQPFKLASRQFHPEDSVFPLDGFTVGGEGISIIAGPCSVESRSQILETAHAVKEAGASALRGGVFKPRTSPTLSRDWARKAWNIWPKRATRLVCRLWPRSCPNPSSN